MIGARVRSLFIAWPLAIVCLAGSLLAQDKRNFLRLPMQSAKTCGSVMLCGGGRMPEEVYDEFVRVAGGRKARLILIPSAYPYGDRSELHRRFAGWKDYNVASFDFLDTDEPDDANDADFVAPLEKATGVWISGGAQSRLIYRYGGRKVEEALRRVVARGGIVAGYSAGAAVLSRVAILRGSSTEAELDDGFGLLQGAVVDTHFTERGRHTRLLGVLDEHPELVAIGLDEGAAVLVQRDHLRVIGDARVTVMLPRGAKQGVVVHQMQGDEEADLSLARASDPSDSPALDLLRSRK